MPSSRQFYLRSVARRWRREVEAATGRVLLFSPFITGRAVELVLGGKRPPGCEVYTLFRAEHFASGASSLDALKQLHDMGVFLYELDHPMLHAKMLIVPGRFASIGSQNLTGQGRRNREATAAFTGRRQVARVAEPAMRWAEQAVPITPQRVREMERLVGPLREQFAAAAEAARRIDRQLREDRLAVLLAGRRRPRPGQGPARRDGCEGGGQERHPDVEERATCWDEEQEEELVERLTEGIDPDEDRLPKEEVRSLEDDWRAEDEESAEEIEEYAEEEGEDETDDLIELADPAEFGDGLDDQADDEGGDGDLANGHRQETRCPINAGDRLAAFRDCISRTPKSRDLVETEVRLVNSHGRPKHSLVALAGHRLTAWEVDGKQVSLERCYRYMCMLGGVCRWGWARVMRTRISFVASAVHCTDPTPLAGFRCKFRFEAVWKPSDGTTANLKVTVGQVLRKDLCRPLLEADCWFGLHSLDILELRAGAAGVADSEAEGFKEWVSNNGEEFRSRVLAHVLLPFKYENNLYGHRADKFFGLPGRPFSVRLRSIGGRYFLVADPCSPARER